MPHDVDQFRQVFNFKPKIVLLWPCSWLPVLIQKLRFASDLCDKKAVTRKQLSHNQKAASASLLRQSLFLNGRFCDLRLERLEDWIYESIVRVCVCVCVCGFSGLPLVCAWKALSRFCALLTSSLYCNFSKYRGGSKLPPQKNDIN